MLKMSSDEYIELRNKTIVELSKKKLNSTDISKLQVQHISNDFFTIAIIRRNSVIRVAINQQTSANLQLLTMCKQDKDYVFPSPRGVGKSLTRPAIEKIINKEE